MENREFFNKMVIQSKDDKLAVEVNSKKIPITNIFLFLHPLQTHQRRLTGLEKKVII